MSIGPCFWSPVIQVDLSCSLLGGASSRTVIVLGHQRARVGVKKWTGQSAKHTVLGMPCYVLSIKLNTAGYSKARGDIFPQEAAGLNRERTLAVKKLFESNSSFKVVNGLIFNGIHSPTGILFLQVCKP